MRAAIILGLGTSPSALQQFQAGSQTSWTEGLPASSNDADAVLIFGGDGTIHRHLPALVRLNLPVLVVPSGSGNDFARSLHLHSNRDSLKAWRNFESGKVQPRAIDLGVIRPAASPETERYFCGVAGCGLDSITARRANQMPRWLRGHGGYALALLPALLKLPAYPMRAHPLERRRRESRHQLPPDFARRFRQHAILWRRHAHRATSRSRRRPTRYLPHRGDESLQTVLYVPNCLLRSPPALTQGRIFQSNASSRRDRNAARDIRRWRVCLRDPRRNLGLAGISQSDCVAR